MVLLNSSDYAEIKKKLKQAQQTSGDTEGSTRADDERLSQLDNLLAEIGELLNPATDER